MLCHPSSPLSRVTHCRGGLLPVPNGERIGRYNGPGRGCGIGGDDLMRNITPKQEPWRGRRIMAVPLSDAPAVLEAYSDPTKLRTTSITRMHRKRCVSHDRPIQGWPGGQDISRSSMDSRGRLRRYPYSRYQPIIQHLTSLGEIYPSIYLWISAVVIKPCNTK